MGSWTAHKASDGRTFYYNRATATSTWTRPADADLETARHHRPDLQHCLDQSPAVATLFNAILRHCGADALPRVSSRTADDPLCQGGRGGAYCCRSKRIYVCTHAHVGCREIAYELSHALNVCRGTVHCRSHGLQIDGTDCGFLGPPDVACSELRASQWTARCNAKASAAERQRCAEWHARWAVRACYPDDEHLEAHVRWARYRCALLPDDRELGAAAAAEPARREAFTEQAHRW